MNRSLKALLMGILIVPSTAMAHPTPDEAALIKTYEKVIHKFEVENMFSGRIREDLMG